jgi:hypothetical protein
VELTELAGFKGASARREKKIESNSGEKNKKGQQTSWSRDGDVAKQETHSFPPNQ